MKNPMSARVARKALFLQDSLLTIEGRPSVEYTVPDLGQKSLADKQSLGKY